jgi:hypothetical protein
LQNGGGPYIPVFDVHGAAATTVNLGNLEGRRGNYLDSGRWLIKGISALSSTNDPATEKTAGRNFLIMFRRASPDEKRQLRAMWEQARLGALPEDDVGEP